VSNPLSTSESRQTDGLSGAGIGAFIHWSIDRLKIDEIDRLMFVWPNSLHRSAPKPCMIRHNGEGKDYRYKGELFFLKISNSQVLNPVRGERLGFYDVNQVGSTFRAGPHHIWCSRRNLGTGPFQLTISSK